MIGHTVYMRESFHWDLFAELVIVKTVDRVTFKPWHRS